MGSHTDAPRQGPPLNFAGAPWLAQAFFGTGDLYGDPPAGP
jgi:hypothetical protein